MIHLFSFRRKYWGELHFKSSKRRGIHLHSDAAMLPSFHCIPQYLLAAESLLRVSVYLTPFPRVSHSICYGSAWTCASTIMDQHWKRLRICHAPPPLICPPYCPITVTFHPPITILTTPGLFNPHLLPYLGQLTSSSGSWVDLAWFTIALQQPALR